MKGARADLTYSACAIARALQVVGDWWSLLIVRDVFAGINRFNEIQRSLGCAKNILSSRLRKLTDDGVLIVEGHDQGSGRRYILTEKGRGLHVVLVALWQWGAENCTDGERITRVLADRATGKIIEKLKVVAVDGESFAQKGFDIVSPS